MFFSPRLHRLSLTALFLMGATAFAEDTPATTPQPAELFTTLDKNSDGKLTKDEVKEDQLRFFERLIRLGDKDEDGILTKEEFVAASQESRPEEDRPRDAPRREGAAAGRFEPGELFRRLDADNDGKLTLDEVPEALRPRIAPIFERLGKDALTREELLRGFVPSAADTFKRLDLNSDGKLSRDEVPAFLGGRFAPAFEKAGKDELTQEEFVQATEEARPPIRRRPENAPPAGEGRPSEGRPSEGRPGEGQPGEGRPGEGRPGERPPFGGRGRFGNGAALFRQLDTNGDGKVTLEEIPERLRERMAPIMERLGKDSLTAEDFARVGEGLGRPAEGRGPEGRGPADRPREGQPGEARPGDDRPGEGRPGDPPPREGRMPGRGGFGRPGGGFGGARLPPSFQKLDADENGQLSKEELAKLPEIFSELDANEDGQIDMRELFGFPRFGEGVPPRGDGPPRGEAGPPRGEGRPPREGAPREGAPREGRERPAEETPERKPEA